MLGTLLALGALSAPPPDLALLGVVVGRRPEATVAILRSAGRTRVAALGETAFGGRVSVIDLASVSLDFDGEAVVLRLPGEAPARRSAEPVRPLPPPIEPPEDPATPARSFSRQDLDRRLASEIPRILAETTVVPVTEDGRVAGFAVTRVPEGSLLAEAGLRAGDVLTRLNDVPIDSLATLIALYPKLQSETRLHAVVLRGGRPVSLLVTLK